MGTICRANTAMNRTYLPLKSIQAKAYAARVARLIGISTAGRVMTIELIRLVVRPSPVAPPVSTSW